MIGPLLGQGGMGNVHEAWDVVLCRTVALKILKDIEPAALIRFMHEAQIHARVVHPNICRIYDVDNYEGTLRVAMQLVPGSNLEQAYRELSVPEVVTIMALVAQAVHVVHRLKLIHRDLKPSNILLERGAEGQWTPYVCDFGLAMALDEPALTYSHSVLGTPAYMAPEQFQGDRERISPATDIYALGGTLHYALTGHPPAGLPLGRSPGKRSMTVDTTLPKPLRVIIEKCLQADPERRYPSASALAEDLWRFQEGVPIQASNLKFLSHLGHQGRKHLIRLLPSFAFLAVGILAGAGLAFQFLRDQGLDRQETQLAQKAAFAAGNLQTSLGMERMLPVHDMRPTYSRLRNQLEFDQARVAPLGARHQGPGHFALGCADYQLQDFARAREQLEQAWAEGFRTIDAARMLLRTLIAGSRWPGAEPKPALETAAGQAEARLLQGRELGGDANDFDQALTAFLQQDYARAAGEAAAHLQACPWHYEAAALQAASLTALARQSLDAGDLSKARSRFLEAMQVARNGLEVGQSDQALYDVYLQAARGLVALNLESGKLSLDLFPELQTVCDKARRIDPDDPGLQDDWLAFRWLKSMRMLQLGLDPGPELQAAMAFLGSWTREPLTLALRADRMVVYWQMAERNFALGRDPDPALTESLKTSAHTPFLGRDYLWEVLNFKARVDAARGIDPRPSLDDAMSHLQLLLQSGASWTLRETTAGSWLIRAEWEGSHGQDPSASLRNAQLLARSAQDQNPASPSAYALEGLAEVLDRSPSPAGRVLLLAQARQRLRLSLALGAGGWDQARLKRALMQTSEADPSPRPREYRSIRP